MLRRVLLLTFESYGAGISNMRLTSSGGNKRWTRLHATVPGMPH